MYLTSPSPLLCGETCCPRWRGWRLSGRHLDATGRARHDLCQQHVAPLPDCWAATCDWLSAPLEGSTPASLGGH